MIREIQASVPLFAASMLLACPSPGPQPGGSGNYTKDLDDEPDFSDPHGLVQVESWLDYGETQLMGAFADGPRMRFHEESERIGNCRLMTHTPSTCDPPCEGDSSCLGGECVAWPVREDRGDLLWTWPDGEQTVTPDGTLAYFAIGSASSEGEVSIEVDGLALTASTIGPPLESGSFVDAITSRGSGDATLRWKDPILDARIRLQMTDCTGSHGGFAAAELECEGPDSGELIVPGSFLDELEAGDWSHGECGSHTFERYHASAPDGEPTTRLETIGAGSLFYFPGMESW
jgi:hypothetical protein